MLYNLQAVRIFAIYLVVLFHFRELMAAAGLQPLRYGGVDILLIFTGFLAVRVTMQKPINPGRFLIERLVRIAPLYWLMTLFVFTLALIAPGAFQATRPDFLELAKSLSFIPFVKTNGIVQPLVYVGWTLNYQVVFYALFAIGMLARPRLGGVAFVSMVLIGLAAAGAILRLPSVDEQFYTKPIILDFVMGMAIGVLFSSAQPAAPDRLKSLLCAAGATAALVVYFWGGLGGEHAPRVLSKGAPAALFLIGILGLERYGVSLKSSTVNYWAKATYSIFLTHIFVAGLAMHAARHWALEGAAALALLIAGTIAVTTVGCLTYEYIEKPLTRLSRRIIFGAPVFPDAADQVYDRLRQRS